MSNGWVTQRYDSALSPDGSKEEQFILKCLSDICNGRLTEKPSQMLDYEKVFRITNEHCLDSLLYSNCREWIGHSSAGKMFRGVFRWHIFYSINRADFLKEITKRFKKENISFICFKGSVFREYYPDPALRTMGDLDIVIHHEDREAVDRILREDMHLNRMIDNHAVWTYWLEGFQFEIHDHMFYENLANRIDYCDYFDRIWEHCHHDTVFGIDSDNLYVPDEDFHFLYLVTHTSKHIINNGSGFRAYVDMVLICKNGKIDNWTEIEHELEILNLLSFAKTCMSLCERWFDVKMPMRLGVPDETFLDSVTEKTFHDGIFGFDNAENKGADAAKEIKGFRGPYYFGAIKRIIRKLFPPYEDLLLVSWYSFIDGRPWLLPAIWVYRWFYCATKKTKHSLSVLSEPFVRKDMVNQRQEYLVKWGL